MEFRHRWMLPAALALTLPSQALAQRAAYATLDELKPEGWSFQHDASIGLQYQRVLDPARLGGLANVGVFALHSRALYGRRVAYCTGFDGHVGAGDTGFAYHATLLPVGIGARWGAGNHASLCGGGGIDGVVGALAFAGRFPAQIALAQNVGPLRVTLTAGVAWIAGAPERRGGVSWLSAVDEVEAMLSVRLGRQHRYWAQTNAGAGPALGVVYRELMGTRMVGVVLALELSGAR